MKGSDFTLAHHEYDVQDIAAETLTDDAAAPLTKGVVSVNPDALRVEDDRFGVLCGETVLFDVLEVSLIPVEHGHDPL